MPMMRISGFGGSAAWAVMNFARRAGSLVKDGSVTVIVLLSGERVACGMW